MNSLTAGLVLHYLVSTNGSGKRLDLNLQQPLMRKVGF